MNSNRIKKEQYIHLVVGGTAAVLILLIGYLIGVVELSPTSVWMLGGILIIVFPCLMFRFRDSIKRPNERKK